MLHTDVILLWRDKRSCNSGNDYEFSPKNGWTWKDFFAFAVRRALRRNYHPRGVENYACLRLGPRLPARFDYKSSPQSRKGGKMSAEDEKLLKNSQPRGDKELFQFGKAVFHSVSYLISRLLISEWSIVRLCLFPPNREQIPGSRRVANEVRQRNAREENGFELIANWHSSEPAFADTSPTDSTTAIFRTSINFLISSFHVSPPHFARADSSGRSKTCRFLRFHSDFQRPLMQILCRKMLININHNLRSCPCDKTRGPKADQIYIFS